MQREADLAPPTMPMVGHRPEVTPAQADPPSPPSSVQDGRAQVSSLGTSLKANCKQGARISLTSARPAPLCEEHPPKLRKLAAPTRFPQIRHFCHWFCPDEHQMPNSLLYHGFSAQHWSQADAKFSHVVPSPPNAHLAIPSVQILPVTEIRILGGKS